MKAESQQPEGREGAIDSDALIAAISETTNLADKVSCIPPAKIIFGSVVALLTLIRVFFLLLCYIYHRFTHSQDSPVNELDYVGLGLLCVDICRTLDRGTDGKRPDEFSHSVYGAIDQFSA